MHILKLYADFPELNRLIRSKLSDKVNEETEEFDFVPIKIGINDRDLTVEAIFVATRK